MERLASFLLSIISRCEPGAHTHVHLPMRRVEIADFLGLTIETVSRTLTKMRMAKLIEIVNHTDVRVLDLDRLKDYAKL